MAHLKAAGILQGGAERFQLDSNMTVEVSRTNDGIDLVVPRLHQDLCEQFDRKDARFWIKNSIGIVYRELQFGWLPYFICPLSQKDCIILIICDDVVCSTEAFRDLKTKRSVSSRSLSFLRDRQRLLRLDGTRRLSAEEKEALLMALQKHPERFKADADLQRYLDNRVRSQGIKAKRFLHESRPLSTTKGMDCGRGINQYDFFLEVHGYDTPWVVPPFRYPDKSSRPTRSPAKRFPELDIKVALEKGLLSHEKFTGRTLDWPPESTDNQIIYLFVDARGEVPRLIFAFEDMTDGTRKWQEVDVLYGPNSTKIRYFLCPVSHARCEVLFLRSGFFASKEAHNISV